jgi:hypothetical protein
MIPDLRGTYFFADYCSATIWSFRYDGVNKTDFQNRTAELAPGGGLSINSITSFGEDSLGELYICDQSGGEVFKIIAAEPVDDDCCDPCDINCDGDVNTLDIEPFIAILTQGATPCSACAGDTSGDGTINTLDIEPFVDCLTGP